MDTSKLMELMKQKKSALKQKSKTLKPNPGTNRYVLLQGWRVGEEHVYYHEYGQHYVKNAANEIQAVYPCMDAIYGKACPVCEGIGKAIRMTSDEDTVKMLEDAACGLKKQKYLVNVLALDSDDPSTPQILELGKQAFGQLVDIVTEWAGGIFDKEEPQVVVVSREGKALNTKYTVQISPKKTAMPAGAMKKINNLDEYVLQENEENMRRALSAINSVAGLLPAEPSRDRPRAALGDGADDSLRAMEIASSVKSSKADVSLDSELDDLLGELADAPAVATA